MREGSAAALPETGLFLVDFALQAISYRMTDRARFGQPVQLGFLHDEDLSPGPTDIQLTVSGAWWLFTLLELVSATIQAALQFTPNRCGYVLVDGRAVRQFRQPLEAGFGEFHPGQSFLVTLAFRILEHPEPPDERLEGQSLHHEGQHDGEGRNHQQEVALRERRTAIHRQRNRERRCQWHHATGAGPRQHRNHPPPAVFSSAPDARGCKRHGQPTDARHQHDRKHGERQP